MGTFEVLENGDLKIAISDEFKWFIGHLCGGINESCESLPLPIIESRVMKALVETFSDGKYAYWDGADEFFRETGVSVGLTSCPVIAERAEVDDLIADYEVGEIDEWCKVWGYMNYAIRLETMDLFDKGYVIFTYGGTMEEIDDEEKITD